MYHHVVSRAADCKRESEEVEMQTFHLDRIIPVLVLSSMALTAQVGRDVVPLKNWPAPLYWQPAPSESEAAAQNADAAASALTVRPLAATPVGSLVFVAMTPCRVVDTRASQGFPSPFGPPTLTVGTTLSYPLQSSTLCVIPSTAQAYSFNVTLVPNPTGNPVGYLKIFPTAAPPNTPPNAVTIDDVQGSIINNAAVVPAGITNGSVSVIASGNTDLVLDINGYYAPSTGVTLALGSASAPSLSFTGEPLTGIYSTGGGVLDIAAAGTNQLTVTNEGVMVAGTLAVTGGITTGTLTALGGITFGDGTQQTTAANGPYWFGAFLPGAITSTWTAASVVPSQNIAVKRVTVNLKTVGSCGPATLQVGNGTTTENIFLPAGTSAFDSGPETVPFAVPAAVTVTVTSGGVCTSGTPPADANVLVQYIPTTGAVSTTCGSSDTLCGVAICTNTNLDINNCGGCGRECPTNNDTPACTAGACTIASCNAGYGNCDSNPANGCETNITTSPNNCGACGNVCSFPNAVAGCTSGVCFMVSCNAGYVNCGGVIGCVNTSNDSKNCGACGHVCAGGQSCTSGVCHT
jgi:hypothetical protein